jgi:molecular chaperone DnaJ
MDFYVVLGVRRGASDSDIRRAYKRLARQFHPDINPGDGAAAARFRDIALAYETLVDPDRRQSYDRGDPAPVVVPAAGFAGFDFSPRVNAEPSTTFGDLFAEVIRGTGERGAVRGADVHVATTISIEDVLVGTRRQVTVHRQAACAACAGTGAVRTAPVACSACEGRGVHHVARGHMMFTRPCDRCGGTGHRSAQRCGACAGRGLEPRVERLDVDIPAGIADGARVCVDGMGHAGMHGGRPGDALVEIQVAPHPLYRRDGGDLHVEVPVAVHEAALGTRVGLPAIDGAALRLRVPPGTQSGQRFRLRERGLPTGRSGVRGDVIAEVRVMLPAVLDERSKELLREFGRVQHESVRDARFPQVEEGR